MWGIGEATKRYTVWYQKCFGVLFGYHFFWMRNTGTRGPFFAGYNPSVTCDMCIRKQISCFAFYRAAGKLKTILCRHSISQWTTIYPSSSLPLTISFELFILSQVTIILMTCGLRHAKISCQISFTDILTVIWWVISNSPAAHELGILTKCVAANDLNSWWADFA